MAETMFDLVVIGAGPGGYVAAIRGAQLGLKVACVEKESVLGGACLRVGCIPSKALLESSELYYEAKNNLAEHGVRLAGVEFDLAAMHARKDKVVQTNGQGVVELLKKNKVTHLQGHARFAAGGQLAVTQSAGTTDLVAKHFIIATGSKVAKLRGVECDGDRIGTSTEALTFQSVPKRLVVIGAGAIGLELGSVWQRLGAQVTVLEYLDRILPEMDAEVAREAHKILQKQGLKFQLGCRVKAARLAGKDCLVECEGQDAVAADRVLVAVGRVPNTDDLGLEAVGVQLDGRGRIQVNEHFETNVPGVFAIGDVIPGPMLAHKAEEEGVACVERIVTGYGHVNYNAIPSVVYTAPEVASVGQTQEQLTDKKVPFKRGVFHFRANGRARILGHADGFVKILAHAETDRILGVHIVGPRAGDLIAEAAAAIEFGASSEDLARTCHAHPTLPEAIKEAALAVDRRAIHA